MEIRVLAGWVGLLSIKRGEQMECQVKDITIYYEEIGSGRPLFVLHSKALFRALAGEWLDRVEEYTLTNTSQHP